LSNTGGGGGTERDLNRLKLADHLLLAGDLLLQPCDLGWVNSWCRRLQCGERSFGLRLGVARLLDALGDAGRGGGAKRDLNRLKLANHLLLTGDFLL